MKISDLVPHIANPRKISKKELDMLKKSLNEFGDLSGIIWNKTTGRLIGGHQRLKVLPHDAEVIDGFIHVGNEKFTFREVEWDEVKEGAALIAANKHGGEWDFKILTELLTDLDSHNVDMELTGFSMEELQKLMEGPKEAPNEIQKKLVTCPSCQHVFDPKVKEN